MYISYYKYRQYQVIILHTHYFCGGQKYSLILSNHHKNGVMIEATTLTTVNKTLTDPLAWLWKEGEARHLPHLLHRQRQQQL
jgi:hypothetical protein